MRIEQVRAHHRTHIGQTQIELLTFLQFDGRTGPFRIQDTVGDDLIRQITGPFREAEGVQRIGIRHHGKAVAGDQMHTLGIRWLHLAR